MRIRLSAIGFVLILMTLIMTSCTKKMELRQYNIVSGIGVDGTEDGDIRLTVETVIPLPKERGLAKAGIVSVTGYSSMDAARNFIEVNHRKLLWKHTKVIVFGKKLAEQGIYPGIDFFVRDHESRLKMYGFVADESAKAIFSESRGGNTPLTARAMEKSMDEQRFVGKAPLVRFYEFATQLAAPDEDAYLPIIRMEKEHFVIGGTAIFQNDRLIGTLSEEQTRPFLRLRNKLGNTIETFDYHGITSRESSMVSVEVKSSRTQCKVVIVNGLPEITFHIKERAFLGDVKKPIPISTSALGGIKKQYEEHVREDMQSLLDTMLQWNTNAMGLANTIHRQHKHYWHDHQNEWPEIRKKIKFHIIVETQLRETGRTRSVPISHFKWDSPQ